MALFDKTDNFIDKRHIESKLVCGSFNKNYKPLISILMPIYNHPQFFFKALNSAINQICDFPYEIIVCDNNHPNYQKQNQKIVNEINSDKVIYFVNEENIGGIGNWNRCIELAHAEDVTFCHDDDMLLPNALYTLLSVRLSNVNKQSAIFGRFNSIDKYDNIIKKYNYRVIPPTHRLSIEELFWTNISNCCGCLFNKKALLDSGGFDSNYIPCPDYALNCKYVYYYGGSYLSYATFNYRISEYGDSSVSFILLPNSDSKVRDEMIPFLNHNHFSMKLISICIKQVAKFFYKSQWQPVSVKEKVLVFPIRVFLFVVRKFYNISI